jgi:hypothetical protein
VVVRGTAQGDVGDQVKMLQENESIYIPVGRRTGWKIPARSIWNLIEVQTGSYLGEDDIIRFEDDYAVVSALARTVHGRKTKAIRMAHLSRRCRTRQSWPSR